MRNKIDFSCIFCDGLQYVPQSLSYVCVTHCIDLKDTDICMRCKFRELRRKERRKRSGKVL